MKGLRGLDATDEEIESLFDGINIDNLLAEIQGSNTKVWIDGCSVPAFNATRWNAMFPGLSTLQSNCH